MAAVNRRVVIILGSVLLLSLVGGTVLMLGDNEAERIEALAEEAQEGSAQAQYQLAHTFMSGSPDAKMEPNFQLAEQWFLKAAEQGHQPSQHSLAGLYMSSGDFVGAYAWYTVAASGTNGLTTQLRDDLAERMSRKELGDGKKLAAQLRRQLSE